MWNPPWKGRGLGLGGSSGRKLVARPYGLKTMVYDGRGGYYRPKGTESSLRKEWAKGIDRLGLAIISREITPEEIANLFRAIPSDYKQHTFKLGETVLAARHYLNNEKKYLPQSTVNAGPEAIQDALESDLLSALEYDRSMAPIKYERTAAFTIVFDYE